MRHGLGVRLAYPVLKFIVRIGIVLFAPLRVKGGHRVPRKGGLLILANHIADIDPPTVQLACRRRIHFMAKSELFEMKVVKHVIRWFRAFPVKRGEPDRAAIRYAIELVKAGEAVCIFPEGELSQSGKLQPLLPGAALIVRKAGVPVICCGLRNTNKVMPYGSVGPRPAFCSTRAHWGEVRTFDKSAKGEEIIGWAESQLRKLTGQ